MKYEPYNFDSFKELVAHAYNLGWYGGRRILFNLKCEGAFEGWSGRATEDWEQRFTLTSDDIQIDGDGGRTIPALNITGSSVKEVCDKALAILKN
jgi:hypothetical protein